MAGTNIFYARNRIFRNNCIVRWQCSLFCQWSCLTLLPNQNIRFYTHSWDRSLQYRVSNQHCHVNFNINCQDMFLKNSFFICANNLIFNFVLKTHCFNLLYQCRLILFELWSIPYVLQASNISMYKYIYLEIRRFYVNVLFI